MSSIPAAPPIPEQEQPGRPERPERSATGLYAIDARNLVKTYQGDVRAVDGLSFAVESGTIFGLLGPNGAGKSTAVKIENVHEVTIDGDSLHARADNGAISVPAVLGALVAAGIQVASVTVSRPSLDDVYLRYTGQTFSEAQEGDTQ